MLSSLSPWVARRTTVVHDGTTRSMERCRAHIRGAWQKPCSDSRSDLQCFTRTRRRPCAHNIAYTQTARRGQTSDLVTARAARSASSRHWVCDGRLTNVHIIALVVGCAIVCVILWDAFETLVLPRTPMRRVRLTRMFYRTTWTCWAGCGRKL